MLAVLASIRTDQVNDLCKAQAIAKRQRPLKVKSRNNETRKGVLASWLRRSGCGFRIDGVNVRIDSVTSIRRASTRPSLPYTLHAIRISVHLGNQQGLHNRPAQACIASGLRNAYSVASAVASMPTDVQTECAISRS